MASATRLIFFETGELHAIVNADQDHELEPHQGPPGAVFVDVPKAQYLACKEIRDHMALALPVLAKKDISFASKVSSKIKKIDDDKAAAEAAAKAKELAAELVTDVIALDEPVVSLP